MKRTQGQGVMNLPAVKVLLNIAVMSAMLGGFGIPHPSHAPPPLLLSTDSGAPPPAQKRQLRAVAERKARRSKRKQRGKR